MTSILRDIRLVELIDDLTRAHRIFGDVIDSATEGVGQYDIETVFSAIDAAAEFLADLRLSSHSGGGHG